MKLCTLSALAVTIVGLLLSSGASAKSAPQYPACKLLRQAKVKGTISRYKKDTRQYDQVVTFDTLVPVYEEFKGSCSIPDPGFIGNFAVDTNGRTVTLAISASLDYASNTETKQLSKWLHASAFIIDPAQEDKIPKTFFNGGAGSDEAEVKSLKFFTSRWFEEEKFDIRVQASDDLNL